MNPGKNTMEKGKTRIKVPMVTVVAMVTAMEREKAGKNALNA
jgi:hypothetical protein